MTHTESDSTRTPGLSRRDVLRATAGGFGYLAFAALAAGESSRAHSPLTPQPTHHAPRAKRVIMLFMQGGPSQVDTFDHKPALDAAGEKGQRDGKRGKLLASPWKFLRCGTSGLPISEVYPHLALHADDLCLLNGMYTDNPAHPQATIMLHTGSINFVRPSLGAWTVYGLGTENRDLPGFVTINPLTRLGGAQNYGSAFLPATYQGTPLNARGGSRGNAVANLSSPELTRQEQRKQLDLVQQMNREMLARSRGDQEIEAVIESFELAYRMQAALPRVIDLERESQRTRDLYGIGDKQTDTFGRQCLMARRLAESGVRFIELTHNGWDQHKNLKTRLKRNALQTDRPIAGLIADLKQRGMLEDTLIIWGGEFGRTPVAQDKSMDGRRHNHRGFSMWLAGGGVRGGLRHGATDELGGVAVDGKVHTHDLHATILHLLGLDHERLTYRYAGRDFRLTDVYGNVIEDILA